VAAVETVLTLDIPYCGACVNHARAYEKGTVAALLYPTAIVLAASFFAGIIGLAVTGGGSPSLELGLMLWLPAAVTVLFVAYRVVMRKRAAVDSRHTSTAPVLRVAGWTDDEVLLDCENTSYALLLRELSD
jgi:hypothetical protein